MIYFFALADIYICNFADYTTPLICDQSIEHVLTKLKNNPEIAISWFEYSYMEMKNCKYHLLISGNKHQHMWVKIGNDII